MKDKITRTESKEQELAQVIKQKDYEIGKFNSMVNNYEEGQKQKEIEIEILTEKYRKIEAELERG